MSTRTRQVSFDYARESDVLFIGLGSDEPSYSEEIDDIVLTERGLFTDRITGFRVIGVRQSGVSVPEVLRVIRRAITKEARIIKKWAASEIRAQEGLPRAIGRTITRVATPAARG